MDLNLDKPLIFFDIESTGLNIATDSIIELCFVKVFPNNEQKIKTWKIKPWDYENKCQRSICPSASAVNGVVDKDLIDCPLFIDVVEEIIDELEDSDLSGYNSAKFDLPILSEEIEKAGLYYSSLLTKKNNEDIKEKATRILSKIDNLDLHSKRMIDVQTIFHYMEPRNLKAAYRFYCGKKDLENAHTAEADTLATFEILKGQLDMYKEADDFHTEALKNDVDSLSNIAKRNTSIDFAGRLALNDKDEVIITFGKHKGKTAKSIWETEPAYFGWIEQADFTLDTKRQFEKLKKQFEQEKEEELKSPASTEQLNQLFAKFNNQ